MQLEPLERNGSRGNKDGNRGCHSGPGEGTDMEFPFLFFLQEYGCRLGSVPLSVRQRREAIQARGSLPRLLVPSSLL